MANKMNNHPYVFEPNRKILSWWDGGWSDSRKVYVTAENSGRVTHSVYTEKDYENYGKYNFIHPNFQVIDNKDLRDLDEEEYYGNFGWLRPLDCNGAEILNEFKASHIIALYNKLSDMEKSLVSFHLQGDQVKETTSSIKNLSNSLLDSYMIAKALLEKYCQHNLSL